MLESWTSVLLHASIYNLIVGRQRILVSMGYTFNCFHYSGSLSNLRCGRFTFLVAYTKCPIIVRG